MRALVAGARLGASRLATARGVAALLVTLALVLLGALLERRVSALLAPDRALGGIVFGVAVPLLGWAMLGSATAGRRLDESVRELSRHGANRRWAAGGLVVVAGATLALAAALCASVGVLATRLPGDPQLGRDLLLSSRVGLLAGMSYAAWLALGSTLGGRGGGRGLLLAADWLLGAGTGLLALPLPRGHVRNLLGAPPVLEMSQPAASLALGLLVAIYAGLTFARIRR
jgi:hypothetical protein